MTCYKQVLKTKWLASALYDIYMTLNDLIAERIKEQWHCVFYPQLIDEWLIYGASRIKVKAAVLFLTRAKLDMQ